jgi:hypothetical protein
MRWRGRGQNLVLRALFVSLCRRTSVILGHDSGVPANPHLASCATRADYWTARGKQPPKDWGCNWNHGFKTAAKPPVDE